MSEKLARFIRERGLDLAEIAEAVGTTPRKLSEILEGKRRFPADLFIDICKWLHIDMNQLREG